MNSWLILYLLVGVITFLFGFSPPVFAAQVLINEFVANANSGENEWVEFYNPDAIEASSYWIDDDANFSDDSGNSTKRSISSVDTANPNFPVFTLSSAIFNNTCDTACDYVVLFSSDGSIIDQYQYTSDQISQKGKSIGRSPDGSSNWVILTSITKGSPNSTSEPTVTSTSAPTSTPTPTAAPTATKTPTPTPVKTPTPTPKSSSTVGSGATATPKPTVSPTPIPTKVLALSSQAAGGSGNINTVVSPTVNLSPTSTKSEPTKKPTPTPIKSGQASVLGVTQSNLSKILIGLGIIFLAACGIIALRTFKKEDKTTL